MSLQRRHLIYVLTTLIISTVTGDIQWQYQCGILGCEAGADTCKADGDCQCGNTGQGYLCKTNTGVCTRTCNDAGTVKDNSNNLLCTNSDPATEECYCDEGYYGSSCEHSRFLVTCDSTSVTVDIHLPQTTGGGAYTGSIKLVESEAELATTTCTVDTSTGRGKVYYGTSTDTSACKKNLQTDTNGDVSVYMIVDDNTHFQLSTSHRYLIKCNPSTGNAHHSTQGGFVVTQTGSDFLEGAYTEAGGLIMEMRDDQYQPIASPANVGDSITLVIQHPNLFTVKTCKASAPGDSDTVAFYENYCVPDNYKSLFRGAIQWQPASGNPTSIGGRAQYNVLVFPLKAWKYRGSTTMSVECDVCFTDECKNEGITPAGGSPTCPTGTAALTTDLITNTYTPSLNSRRRRRDTDSVSTVIGGVNVTSFSHTDATSLYLSLVVLEGQGVTVRIGDDMDTGAADEAVGCYRNVSVILPLVLLAVLLLVTMAMTVFFCNRLTRNTAAAAAAPTGAINMAYKS